MIEGGGVVAVARVLVETEPAAAHAEVQVQALRAQDGAARRKLGLPAVVAVGEGVVGEAAGDGIAQVGGPGRVEGVGAAFDAERRGTGRHGKQVLAARQPQRQFVLRLQVGAEFVDEAAVARGRAAADLRVERQPGRNAVLDAQPGTVVADGGAAVRPGIGAAGFRIDRLAVGSAEQAGFGVDHVFARQSGVAERDVVGGRLVAQIEGGVGPLRRVDEAGQVGGFLAVQAQTCDVGKARQRFARAMGVMQGDGAGVAQFVVVVEFRLECGDEVEGGRRPFRPGQHARLLLAVGEVVAEACLVIFQQFHRTRVVAQFGDDDDVFHRCGCHARLPGEIVAIGACRVVKLVAPVMHTGNSQPCAGIVRHNCEDAPVAVQRRGIVAAPGGDVGATAQVLEVGRVERHCMLDGVRCLAGVLVGGVALRQAVEQGMILRGEAARLLECGRRGRGMVAQRMEIGHAQPVFLARAEALAVERVVFLDGLGVAAFGFQFHVLQHHVLVLRTLRQVGAIARHGGVLLAAARVGPGETEQGIGILGRRGKDAFEAVGRHGVIAGPQGDFAACAQVGRVARVEFDGLRDGGQRARTFLDDGIGLRKLVVEAGVHGRVLRCLTQGFGGAGGIVELGGANVGDAFPQIRLRGVGCQRPLIDVHCVGPLTLHLGTQAGVGDGLCSRRQRCRRETGQREDRKQFHLRHRRLRKIHRSAAKRPIVTRSNSSTA